MKTSEHTGLLNIADVQLPPILGRRQVWQQMKEVMTLRQVFFAVLLLRYSGHPPFHCVRTFFLPAY